ncbi:mevalonate kinase [Microbacterium indicum]|uniref:mevalonate kinase n=1 Tax=Microbacterium indicum TaxID=358100 RepID=UPI0004192CCC|nr:mevalonate kinase [Microbacterium indicum]
MTPPLRSGREARDAGPAPRAARAHGKAVLFGEHAVVYGAPAVAVPLPALAATASATLRASGPPSRIESALYAGPAEGAPAPLSPVVEAIRAALDLVGAPAAHVSIRSDVPVGRGLGSSAAVAAAVVQAVAGAVGRALDPEERHGLIQVAERAAHGTPSGLDARAVVAAGPIRFHAGLAAPLALGAPLTLVIADSGAPGSTAEAVAGVRAMRDARPHTAGTLIDRLGSLAKGSTEDLASGDLDALGARMTDAHGLLRLLDVSTDALDALVGAAARAGALGAKLTGGGLGGCVVALAASPAEAEEIAGSLAAAGARQVWTMTQQATTSIPEATR